MTSLSHSAAPSIRHRRALRLCGLALLCNLTALASLVLPVPPLQAQQKTQRVVEGQVVDKSGAALKGATVFLKDDHTLSVLSCIAADEGTYRFGQLAQSTDYEVWATLNGKKSEVKSISSFDTRPKFNFLLKIDTAK